MSNVDESRRIDTKGKVLGRAVNSLSPAEHVGGGEGAKVEVWFSDDLSLTCRRCNGDGNLEDSKARGGKSSRWTASEWAPCILLLVFCGECGKENDQAGGACAERASSSFVLGGSQGAN